MTYQYYNTDTSREIDRLSRDKLSMPPGMKGILCIKFDLFKIKNTDFWAAMVILDIIFFVHMLDRLFFCKFSIGYFFAYSR